MVCSNPSSKVKFDTLLDRFPLLTRLNDVRHRLTNHPPIPLNPSPMIAKLGRRASGRLARDRFTRACRNENHRCTENDPVTIDHDFEIKLATRRAAKSPISPSLRVLFVIAGLNALSDPRHKTPSRPTRSVGIGSSAGTLQSVTRTPRVAGEGSRTGRFNEADGSVIETSDPPCSECQTDVVKSFFGNR